MVDSKRKKSPRAPTLPLSDAIERALKIYDSERLHQAPTDVVAQALGYKSANNGAALGLIASLRYFGLIERPKEGFLCVSKNVEAYKFAPDEILKKSTILGFLKTPPLYSELLEQYKSGLPSDANLRFELIQKGFSPQSAEPILKAFKDSVEFASYYDNENNSTTISEKQNDDEKLPNKSNDIMASNSEPVTSSFDSGLENIEEKFLADRIPVRLTGGRKAWLIIPSPFYEADKVRLKAQVDLILSEE